MVSLGALGHVGGIPWIGMNGREYGVIMLNRTTVIGESDFGEYSA